jgi:hypothetical protein
MSAPWLILNHTEIYRLLKLLRIHHHALLPPAAEMISAVFTVTAHSDPCGNVPPELSLRSETDGRYKNHALG